MTVVKTKAPNTKDIGKANTRTVAAIIDATMLVLTIVIVAVAAIAVVVIVTLDAPVEERIVGITIAVYPSWLQYPIKILVTDR